MTTVIAKELAIALKLIKHNTSKDSAQMHGITAEYDQITSADGNTELHLLTVVVCFAFMKDHTHSYSDSVAQKLNQELMRKIVVDDDSSATVFETMLSELATKYQVKDFAKYFNALYLMRKNITLVDVPERTLFNILDARIHQDLEHFLQNATIEDLVFTDLAGNLGTAMQEHATQKYSDDWELLAEDADKELKLQQVLATRRSISFAASYRRPAEDVEGRNAQQVKEKFFEFHKLTAEQPQLIRAAISKQLLSVPFIVDYFSAQRADWLIKHDATISLFANVLDRVETYVDQEEYTKGDLVVLQQLPQFFSRWTISIDASVLSADEFHNLQVALNRLPIVLLNTAVLPNTKKEEVDDFHRTLLESLIELMDTDFFQPSFRDQRGQSMLHALLQFMIEVHDNPQAIEFARHLLNELYSKGLDISLPAPSNQVEGSQVGTIFATIMANSFFNPQLRYMYDVLGTQQHLSQEQAMLILQDVLLGILMRPNFVAMHDLFKSPPIRVANDGSYSSKPDTNSLLNFVDILVGFIRKGENSDQVLGHFFADPQLWHGVEITSQTLLLLRRYQVSLSHVLHKLHALNSYEHLRAVCCLVWCKATSVVEVDFNIFHYLASHRQYCADLEEVDYLQELADARDSFDENDFSPTTTALLPHAIDTAYRVHEDFEEDCEGANFYASNQQVLAAMYNSSLEYCAFAKAAGCDNERFFLLFLCVFEERLLHTDVPIIGICNWDPEVVKLDSLVKERIRNLVVNMFKREVGMSNIIAHLEDKTKGLILANYCGFDKKLLKELNEEVENRRKAMLHAAKSKSSASPTVVIQVHENHFRPPEAAEEPPRSPSLTH